MAKHWKKPESKQCKCGAIFSKIGNQTDRGWGLTTNCPRCRDKKGKPRIAESKLGHYEVKNDTIDKFIRGVI